MPARTYSCQCCGQEFTKPEDRCTQCGDRLFWLLIPKYKLDEGSMEVFAASMSRVVNKTVSRAYLTHGGRIWLPDGFWTSDPRGETLRNFPWIGGLHLTQHDKLKTDPSPAPEAGPAPSAKSAPTLEPASVKPAAVAEPAATPTAPAAFVPLQPKPMQDGEPTAQQPARAPSRSESPESTDDAPPTAKSEPPAKRAERPAAAPAAAPAKVRLQKRHWFVPVMIFIFFVFLSLSYLALLYHKNTRTVHTVGSHEVEGYEHPILS